MSSLEADLGMPPQPLSRVCPRATIFVTPKAIALRPKLSPLIAEIIARWAGIEAATVAVLSHLMGAEARPVAAMLNAITSASAQMDMIEAAAWAKLFDPDLEAFEALIKIARAAAKKRNAIAHHLWGHCEDLPDALLLIEPEAWTDISVKFQEALYSTARSQTITFQPDPEQVSVYRENDFLQIIEELKTALNAPNSSFCSCIE